MADKTPSKADQLRAQREERYAQNQMAPERSKRVPAEAYPDVPREVLKPSRRRLREATAPSSEQAPERKRGRGAGLVCPHCGLAYDAPPKPKRAPRGTFDRRAYQRELMRKRRAEGKAK